jgi:hypothetical protein
MKIWKPTFGKSHPCVYVAIRASWGNVRGRLMNRMPLVKTNDYGACCRGVPAGSPGPRIP